MAGYGSLEMTVNESISQTAATTDSLAPDARIPRVIELDVLKALGVDLPKTARILDFGCGAGRTIRSLRAFGYTNTHGYDVGDGRTLLGVDRDRTCCVNRSGSGALEREQPSRRRAGLRRHQTASDFNRA